MRAIISNTSVHTRCMLTAKMNTTRLSTPIVRNVRFFLVAPRSVPCVIIDVQSRACRSPRHHNCTLHFGPVLQHRKRHNITIVYLEQTAMQHNDTVSIFPSRVGRSSSAFSIRLAKTILDIYLHPQKFNRHGFNISGQCVNRINTLCDRVNH